MANAESDQRLVDRFWGLDLNELNLQAEERRLRAMYLQRVAQLNGCLVQTKAIKPFAIQNISPDIKVNMVNFLIIIV